MTSKTILFPPSTTITTSTLTADLEVVGDGLACNWEVGHGRIFALRIHKKVSL